MYKLDFYIRVKNGYKKVSGWGETLEAPDSTIIEIGLDKRSDLWYVTEITSGYSITSLGFKTRKEAIAYISKPEFFCKISSRIKEPDIIKAAIWLSDYQNMIRSYQNGKHTGHLTRFVGVVLSL